MSEDPGNYDDAPREAIRRTLELETGVSYPKDQPINSQLIESIRMGTTVATNALLERKGENIVYCVTSGFSDILQIGNQSRPKIFDLTVHKPDVLYSSVIEINERIYVLSETKVSFNKQNEIDVLKQIAAHQYNNNADVEIVTGLTNEQVVILQPINVDEVRKQLQSVYDTGIRSIAVSLCHSYTYNKHEHIVGDIAKSIGYTHVSLSSELMAMVKLVPRGYTSNADAYLTPAIQRYLHQFTTGFDNEFIQRVNVAFMQSDGGLTTMDKFSGHRAVLSGPAGGVIGYARTTHLPRHNNKNKQQNGSVSKKQKMNGSTYSPRHEVIGFDMGGTSTDVSRYDGSEFEHVFENTIAGVTLMTPQLDINTVAAGGGSMLFFRNGLFIVGPDSAGANPGPACYQRNGPLTITDANLLLNRLLPHRFPKIFGPNRDQPLDYNITKQKFQQLAKEINEFFISQGHDKTMSIYEIALGFITVANETMCRPIRALTQAKGYDIQSHTLACFGGAGGQHATAIAASLGITNIYVHRMAGILSAYGLSLSDIIVEQQEPCALEFNSQNMKSINQRVSVLQQQAESQLKHQGFSDQQISSTVYLNLRYQGTDTASMTNIHTNKHTYTEYYNQYTTNYKREYGFTLDRVLLCDDIRVRATGSSNDGNTVYNRIVTSENQNQPIENVKTYFQSGELDTAVYDITTLTCDYEIYGPALIIDQTSTIVIEPNNHATITDEGSIHIRIINDKQSDQLSADAPVDAIQLSVFSHRFMSIAEQMGRTLQRTSISTNIKERLDFSCALFDGTGGLVANAPHLPVHLGAMQEAVRWQVMHMKANNQPWKSGDVYVSNHPKAGGSHLPDITVITPVVDPLNGGTPIFYVASRGHHSDIGGISPGSMPPWSKTLADEGAAIKSFKLVDQGKFDENGISELLLRSDQHSQQSHLIGTRNLSDNLSDLRAQVAANQKGIQLIEELIDEYTRDVVLAYMKHIQDTAELSVRNMLKSLAKQHNLKDIDTLYAVDYMDDGTPIKLALTIDSIHGTAKFDFSGTGSEIYGNLNAPPAVTYSAIIYCLRCLVNLDIPLNQGCLTPIDIHIPAGTFLNASENAAVVGGNVLTSQRVTDVVLHAFQACAASQGCIVSGTPISVGNGLSRRIEECSGNLVVQSWGGPGSWSTDINGVPVPFVGHFQHLITAPCIPSESDGHINTPFIAKASGHRAQHTSGQCGYIIPKSVVPDYLSCSVLNQGVKPTVVITLINGRQIECTSDHLLLTTSGFKQAGSLVGSHHNLINVNHAGAYHTTILPDTANEFVVRLQTGQPADQLVMSLDAVLDSPASDTIAEHMWRYQLHALPELTFADSKQRDRTLAFSRLVGFILANGCISLKSQSTLVYIGHIIDVECFQADILLVCGQPGSLQWTENVVNDSVNSCWEIRLPNALHHCLCKLDGIAVDKRIDTAVGWPYMFVQNVQTPRAAIREFIAGHFGGDGCTTYNLPTSGKSLAAHKSAKHSDYVSNVKLKHLVYIEHYAALEALYKQLIERLIYLGCAADAVYSGGPEKNMKAENQPTSSIEHQKCNVTLYISDVLWFSHNIGFRYCTYKQMKLTAVSAYWRFTNSVGLQRTQYYRTVIQKMKELNTNHNNKLHEGYLKNAVTALRNDNIQTLAGLPVLHQSSQLTLKQIQFKTDDLCKKLLHVKKMIQLGVNVDSKGKKYRRGIKRLSYTSDNNSDTDLNNSESISSDSAEHVIKSKRKPSKDRVAAFELVEEFEAQLDAYMQWNIVDYIPSQCFFTAINVDSWLNDKYAGLQRTQLSIPTYSLPIVHVQYKQQPVQVWDLSLQNNHAFIANSVVAHNCMNNLTFGDENFGYYETIAGGSGAGPTWNGTSGVQVHMTNTRSTDIEVIERRYPVLMRQFKLRSDSGGKGQYTGGNGVIRDIQFLKPLDVGILSERRSFEPYGLNGGSNGARGLNEIITLQDNKVITLGPRNTYPIQPGDRIRIHTPGGGGCM